MDNPPCRGRTSMIKKDKKPAKQTSCDVNLSQYKINNFWVSIYRQQQQVFTLTHVELGKSS